MDDNVMTMLKYVRWIICLILGLTLWLVALIIIDDTGSWHFEYTGFISDLMRLGIFVGVGAGAGGVAWIFNFILIAFFKRK